GNPSFTAGKLGWMATHPHWLPQLIAAAGKYDKAAVAGPCPVQKLIDHTVNGRVHAEINPHRSEDNGTKSFRFSYSEPPLQQMPSRDEELASLFRGIFLPEEGEVWAKPDASQQEFRFVVHSAYQHKLRNAAEAVARYREDPDAGFHAFAAAITGLDRSAAKAVNFAKMYGAGVTKFAQMIGKPLAEAQQLYARYDRVPAPAQQNLHPPRLQSGLHHALRRRPPALRQVRARRQVDEGRRPVLTRRSACANQGPKTPLVSTRPALPRRHQERDERADSGRRSPAHKALDAGVLVPGHHSAPPNARLPGLLGQLARTSRIGRPVRL